MIYFSDFGAGAFSGARYWRFKFPDGTTSGQIIINEAEMRETVGGSDLATSGGASASAGSGSGSGFDNNFTNYWDSGAGAATNSWLANDLGSAYDLAEVYLQGYYNDLTSQYGPTKVEIEYSSNGSSWTADARWPTFSSLTWEAGVLGTGGGYKLFRRAATPSIIHGLAAFDNAGNSGGWTNYTARNVLPAASIPGPGGNRCRFAIKGGSSEDFTINKAYIGIKSGTYGFAATPVQVTFDSGSNSTTITSGTTKWSDEITLTTTTSDDLVISVFCPSGAGSADSYSGSNQLGRTLHYKSGDDAATTSPSGYTLFGNQMVLDIQVWSV